MQKPILSAAAVGLDAAVAGDVQGAVSYNAVGSTHKQNFDSFPTSHPTAGAITQNAALQPTPYSEAARRHDLDDEHISIPDWHLYHETYVSAGGEGGFNGHQRLRYGNGNSGTGSFYAFAASAANTEKALGVTSSTTIQVGMRSYIGLQLINNTGTTLNSFTIKYDGEQWRDGGSTAVDGFDFQYSTTATDAWLRLHRLQRHRRLCPVPQNGTTATLLDGNAAANRVAGITHTINDITCAGTERRVRWRVPGDEAGTTTASRSTTSTFRRPGARSLPLPGAGRRCPRRRSAGPANRTSSENVSGGGTNPPAPPCCSAACPFRGRRTVATFTGSRTSGSAWRSSRCGTGRRRRRSLRREDVEVGRAVVPLAVARRAGAGIRVPSAAAKATGR